MKKLVKIISLSTILALTMVFGGCSTQEKQPQTQVSEQITESEKTTETEKSPETQPSQETQTTEQITIKDREGIDITISSDISKIISLAPSTTQILIDLGLESKLVAVDKYSKQLFDESNTLLEFDIMNPDAEKLANLEVDIIFATGMSKAQGEDPLKLLKEMGAAVTYIPTSKSIAEIKEDIKFISEATNTKDQGDKIISDMESEINKYAEIGKTITDKKSVYFEIGAAPQMYSFGKDVFLNEIIELIGAKNILENENSWIPVSSEAIVAANPDVIITNVNYIDNPVDEIKLREGFSILDAVKNNQVFQIDNETSSYSNHNIVKAIKAIAEIVYPAEYK